MFGFAYADLSTGEFRVSEVPTRAMLEDELARVSPAKLLMSDDQQERVAGIDGTLTHDSYAFLPEQAVQFDARAEHPTPHTQLPGWTLETSAAFT